MMKEQALWLSVIPLFCVLMIAESCSQYSTGENWQWSRSRSRVYPDTECSSLEKALLDDELPTPTFVQDPSEDTHYKLYRVRARMTACSSQDPGDSHYYRKYGWKGAELNMCFASDVIPKGSLVRIQPSENQYMEVSYPGKFWTVDAKGGPVIRKSAACGKVHGDVKYRTLYSVRKFGSQHVTIEVILPRGYEPGRAFLDNVVEVCWTPKG